MSDGGRKRRRHRGGLVVGVAVVALAALALAPASAAASACCLSAGAYGLGRLTQWERVSVSFDGVGRLALGYWTNAGVVRDVHSDNATRSATATLGVLMRAGTATTLWFRAPWTLTGRGGAVGDHDVMRFGHGVGDLDLGARYDWIAVGAHSRLPGVATTLGLVVPSGRTTAQASDALGVDVTGRGQLIVAASAIAEWTSVPWYGRASVGGRVGIRESAGWRDGIGVDIELAAGRELVDAVVMSAVLSWHANASRSYRGAAISGSEAQSARAGLALAWKFARGWSLRGQANVAPPFARLGRNQDIDVAVGAGLRFAVDTQ